MEELQKVRRVMQQGDARRAARDAAGARRHQRPERDRAGDSRSSRRWTSPGIVLTKLDGTAKGGVILGICDELKVPVRYIGIGEKVADLREFDSRGVRERSLRHAESAA